MNGFMTNWQDRSDFMEQEFVKALPILHHLMKAGHQAYFVGGAVRDSYMKRKIGDVDIATSASPNEVERLFKRTG